MKKLLSADEIAEGVARLAEQIARDYAGRPLTIVGVLTGCVVMLADLIRLVDLPLADLELPEPIAPLEPRAAMPPQR